MQALSPKHPKLAQPLPESSPGRHQVYISGEHFITNQDQLKKMQIGAVLSLTEDPFTLPPQIQHLHLTVSDHPDANISQHLQPAFQFIEKHREKSNVLVHCVAGMSRSAAVCIYYLMRKERWSLETSLQKLRESRPWVRPNEGFVGQLREEEKRLDIRFGRPRF